MSEKQTCSDAAIARCDEACCDSKDKEKKNVKPRE